MEELRLNEDVSLRVVGVPKGFNLFKLGSMLEENIIGTQNFISSIKWIPNPNPSLRNVELIASFEGATALMKRPAFDVIFEEKKWPLTITKLRSKTKKTSKPVLIDSDIDVENDSFLTNFDDDSKRMKREQRETYSKDHHVVNHLQPFQRDIEATGSERIILYINASSSLLDQFQAHWQYIANVAISQDDTNPHNYCFKFDPIHEAESKTQKDFEDKCDMILRGFLSRFSSQIYQNSAEMLQNIRENTRIHKSTEWTVDETVYECFFEWNFDSNPAQVIITGENVAVRSILRHLQFESEKVLSMQQSSSKTPEAFSSRNRDIHQLRTWSELLEEDPCLFEEFPDSCVIVQSLPQQCTYDDVGSFFENEVSSGGKVKRIIRLRDGYLIAFNQAKSARATIDKLDEYDFSFYNQPLEIHFKETPPPDHRLLLIEGKDSSTTKDEIEALLCSLFLLDSSFEVIKSSKKYLVIFERQVDTSELAKEISKQHNYKVKRLCHSDCLLVSMIDSQISNDRLALAFRKRKCDVTFVKRHTNKPQALLFMSSYKDVARMLDSEAINIDDFRLDLDCYLYGFGKLADDQYQMLKRSGKKDPKLSESFLQPKAFCHQFSVKKEVLIIFTNCKSLVNVVNEKLVGVARVEFQRSLNEVARLEVQFSPVKTQRDNFLNQSRFETKCCEETNEILGAFTTVKVDTLSQGAVKQIKQVSYDHNKNTSLIDDDNLHLFIKWHDDDENAATVTGTNAHIQYLKKMHEESQEIILASKSDYEVLSNCGIIADVRNNHSVKISKCGGGASNLLIEGTKSDIDAAKRALTKELERMEHTERINLGEIKERFLTDASRKYEENIESQINEAFRQKHLKAYFELPTLTLHHKPKHFRECQKIVQDLIKFRQFQLQPDFNEIKSSIGWREAQGFIEYLGGLKLYEESKTLTLVGSSPRFVEAVDHINAQLSQSDEKSELIQVDKLKREYIKKFASATGLDEFLKEVKIERDESGLRLQGKQRLLREVTPEIQKIVTNLVITSYPIEEAWKVKYLRSIPGKELLEFQQNDKQCLIVLETVQEQKAFTPFHSNAQETYSSSRQIQSHSKTRYPEVQIPGTSVIVKLVKGDITTHRADAIVNASNQELELRSAGVSGSIMTKGGRSIQHEMDDIRKTLKNRVLETGNAVTTTAGNLRNCSKIVHVAGPEWYKLGPQMSTQRLKQSVLSCLVEAEKHRLSSIAIPAISCGVFGGKPDESAKLIVEAIVKFFGFKKGALSLKRVDLIELSNTSVINAFSKYLNKLPGAQSGIDVGQTSSIQRMPIPEKNSSFAAAVDQPFRFRVIVEEGDILSTQTDVIVNTAGPSFGLEASQLSKKLVRKGGKEIAKQCKNKKECVRTSEKFRITRAGKLHCKFVAHLVLNSNNLQEEVPLDLFEVFKAVDELEQQTIAIPAIGTGNASIERLEAIRIAEMAIEMFKQSNPTFLKTIKIVIYNDNSLYKNYKRLATPRPQPQPFRPKLQLPAVQNPATSDYAESPPADVTSQLVERNHSRNAVMLNLCSMDKEINEEVYRKIDWKFESKYKEKKIPNIPPATRLDDFPESIRRNSDVKITMQDGSHGKEIRVSGYEDDVFEICNKIDQFLKRNRE